MKKVAIAIAVCMVMSIVVSGVVFAGNPNTGAGAQKCTLYDSVPYTEAGGASDTSNPTRSFVILNTDNSGNLIVQIALKKVPTGTYDVYINQVFGVVIVHQDKTVGVGGTLPTFSTNAKGNGNAHYNVPVFVDTAGNRTTHFWVTVRKGAVMLRSQAVMLD